MEVLALLVPLAVVVVIAMGAVFWWSVKSGQFDDLDAPAYSILVDDDDPQQDLTHKEDKKHEGGKG